MTSFMIRINPNPLPTGARFGFIRCGGGGESRTLVHNQVPMIFSERIRCFNIPSAALPPKGLQRQYLDNTFMEQRLAINVPRINDAGFRACGLLGPTSGIKPLLNQFLRLILNCRFLRGPAPRLAYQGSSAMSKPNTPPLYTSATYRFSRVFRVQFLALHPSLQYSGAYRTIFYLLLHRAPFLSGHFSGKAEGVSMNNRPA